MYELIEICEDKKGWQSRDSYSEESKESWKLHCFDLSDRFVREESMWRNKQAIHIVLYIIIWCIALLVFYFIMYRLLTQEKSTVNGSFCFYSSKRMWLPMQVLEWFGKASPLKKCFLYCKITVVKKYLEN
jgi:hypothetical protein